jgi:hypothetical protein
MPSSTDPIPIQSHPNGPIHGLFRKPAPAAQYLHVEGPGLVPRSSDAPPVWSPEERVTARQNHSQEQIDVSEPSEPSSSADGGASSGLAITNHGDVIDMDSRKLFVGALPQVRYYILY